MVFNTHPSDSITVFCHIWDDFIDDVLYIWSYCFPYTLSIVAINIQPYKKAVSRYSLMGMVFYTLLSLVFIAAISRDVIAIQKFSSIIFIKFFPYLIGSIPIVYIATFIIFWIVTRMRCPSS
jgi:hypothetical protein